MIRAHTKSAEDTQSLAAALTQAVRPRDLLLLIGEMGAGKTTFTQGFGKALGISEPITSPTFVLLRSYESKVPLHHADIYRLDHLQEVIDLGLMELLDEGGVALMEWGDVATPVLPRDYLEVRLEIADDDAARQIVLRGVGSMWVSRENQVRECIANWIVTSAEEYDDHPRY